MNLFISYNWCFIKNNRHFPAMYLQSMGYEDEKRKDVLYGYPNAITSYAIPSITIPPWFAEGVAQHMFNDAIMIFGIPSRYDFKRFIYSW